MVCMWCIYHMILYNRITINIPIWDHAAMHVSNDLCMVLTHPLTHDGVFTMVIVTRFGRLTGGSRSRLMAKYA